jgi:aryl-alcohol dehydrogenase-like predicted oxidoreductase
VSHPQFRTCWDKQTIVQTHANTELDRMQLSAAKEIRQLHGAQPDEVALAFPCSFFD